MIIADGYRQKEMEENLYEKQNNKKTNLVKRNRR